MTARQHVAAVLKDIPGIEGVYFVDRPSDSAYPCAIYAPAGNRFFDHLQKPGVTYASWFTVEVRAKSARMAEQLAEDVLRAFRAGLRMERRRDLSFVYDSADAGSVASDAYGVYTALSGYLIREQG